MSNPHETLWKWYHHELIIFTKFHQDWTKSVDFLTTANFWTLLGFFTQTLLSSQNKSNGQIRANKISITNLSLYFQQGFLWVSQQGTKSHLEYKIDQLKALPICPLQVPNLQLAVTHNPRHPRIYRVKKNGEDKKNSLMHQLATRCRTVSNTLFSLYFQPSITFLQGMPLWS